MTITAAALPDAPGAITETSRVDNTIGLSWVAPASDGGSSILAYTLYKIQENEDDEVVYYGTSTSTTILELKAGQTYYFEVTATNAVGEGDASSLYSFLIVEPPSAPLNLAVDVDSNASVTLNWEKPLFNGG